MEGSPPRQWACKQSATDVQVAVRRPSTALRTDHHWMLRTPRPDLEMQWAGTMLRKLIACQHAQQHCLKLVSLEVQKWCVYTTAKDIVI